MFVLTVPSRHVTSWCFQADDFSPGTCSLRWSYVLAVITCCDAFLLGTLALTLSCKQIKLEDRGEQGGFLINNMELSSEIKHHHQQILSQERSVQSADTGWRMNSTSKKPWNKIFLLIQNAWRISLLGHNYVAFSQPDCEEFYISNFPLQAEPTP